MVGEISDVLVEQPEEVHSSGASGCSGSCCAPASPFFPFSWHKFLDRHWPSWAALSWVRHGAFSSNHAWVGPSMHILELEAWVSPLRVQVELGPKPGLKDVLWWVDTCWAPLVWFLYVAACCTNILHCSLLILRLSSSGALQQFKTYLKRSIQISSTARVSLLDEHTWLHNNYCLIFFPLQRGKEVFFPKIAA